MHLENRNAAYDDLVHDLRQSYVTHIQKCINPIPTPYCILGACHIWRPCSSSLAVIELSYLALLVRWMQFKLSWDKGWKYRRNQIGFCTSLWIQHEILSQHFMSDLSWLLLYALSGVDLGPTHSDNVNDAKWESIPKILDWAMGCSLCYWVHYLAPDEGLFLNKMLPLMIWP